MALMNPFDWWKWGDDVVCMKSKSWANCLKSSPLKGGPLLKQECLQLQRVPSGEWWSWNDVYRPLEMCMGTCWSSLPLLGAFFPNGLEKSQHLFLLKVWERPHGVAASQLVGCCTQGMWGIAWCIQLCLLPCRASKCMSWPSTLLCWYWHGFHGGLPWYCLYRTVEWPLVHPWWGGCNQWRVCHGRSSRIWLLWGHDLVYPANCSRWVCAPLRGWGPIESLLWSWSDILGWRWTSIWHWLGDLTWFQCWFWTGGGWGHPPEAFLCLASMWWPGHTAAGGGAFSGGVQGPLWDFLDWSFWGAYGLSPWWMSFRRGMYGIFHNHIQWPRVLSWCWHSRSQCLWGTCLQKQWAVHPGWCRLLAPWVRHHTGGWPVWCNHSISGVWGGLSAVGT